MVKLTYHNFAEKKKTEIITQYPEYSKFFDKLEKRITEHPKEGFSDTCLLENGKSITCFKQNIEVYLFSGRLQYGRRQLTLLYLYSDMSDTILIIKIYFRD
jgi:hypothetical protein